MRLFRSIFYISFHCHRGMVHFCLFFLQPLWAAFVIDYEQMLALPHGHPAAEL
jgi:hypothetical protein